MSVQSDEDDEYLAVVEGQRARALATIERVKALISNWQGGTGHTDNNRFVSIADLRAALEPK